MISPHLLFIALLALASHVIPTDAAVRVWSLRGSGIKGDFANQPDPYAKVFCAGISGGRTDTHKGTSSPNWGGEFNFPNCKSGQNIVIEVWDDDVFNDNKLFTCTHTTTTSHKNPIKCSRDKGTLEYNYTVK